MTDTPVDLHTSHSHIPPSLSFSLRALIHSLSPLLLWHNFELRNSSQCPSPFQGCNLRFPISHPTKRDSRASLASQLFLSIATSPGWVLVVTQSSFVFCFHPNNSDSYKACLWAETFFLSLSTATIFLPDSTALDNFSSLQSGCSSGFAPPCRLWWAQPCQRWALLQYLYLFSLPGVPDTNAPVCCPHPHDMSDSVSRSVIPCTCCYLTLKIGGLGIFYHVLCFTASCS